MKRVLISILIASSVVFGAQEVASAANQKNIEVNQNQSKSSINNCEIFITRLFQGFLGRQPDKGGLDYWSNELYKNNASVSDVVVQMINSEEFKAKKYSNREFVDSIFKGLFGRESDKAGLDYWTKSLNSGNSKEFVLSKMMNSEEFKEYLSGLGINNIGTIKLDRNDKKGEISGLVNQFFIGFQGREGDKGGLDYWTCEIVNNRRSIANVIEGFMDSDEFKSKNYTNSQFVKAMFKGILGRDVDKAGLEYWTESLNKGNSKRFVVSRMMDSKEFKEKLNDLSIDNIGSIKVDRYDKKGEISGVVNQFFIGFQGREGDKGGLDYWTGEIVNNRRSVANVVEGFMYSEEFKSKNYTNSQFVKAMFKGILGRDVDKAGLDYWTDSLEKGNSRKFVVSRMIQSEEFKNKLNELDITNIGSISIDRYDQKGEISGVVNQFFLGFQGREGDKGGLNYWTDEIVNNRRSVANVVEGFIDSDEFKSKNYTGEEFINAVYTAIQGRKPGRDEFNYWLGELVNGKSQKYIISSIFSSEEFSNKLKGLGIDNIGKIALSDKDVQANIAKAKIINATMNLRSKPSLQSQVLTTMKPGSDVVVLERVKGDLTYYKVRYLSDGKIFEGYVSNMLNGMTVVQVYKDNNSNDFLGVLSEKYESNGDPGSVSSGVGDYGGKSYGAWQFSSKMGSLDGFVNWLQNHNYGFYKSLMDARKKDGNTNCGPEFDKVWKKLANDHYNDFYNLQHQYVKENFYDQLLTRLLTTGDYSKVLSSFAVRNAIWSTVVQHGVGGAYSIISPLKFEKDPAQFVKKIYAERGRTNSDGVLVHFYSSSPAVQAGVAKRFKNEEKDALQIYNYEK